MTKKHGKKHEQSPENDMEAVKVGNSGSESGDAVESCNAAKTDAGIKAEQSAGNTEASPIREAKPTEATKAEPSCTERIAELEAKCKDLQDQYLRKAADFDNYRKRMIKEKQEAIDYANTNVLSDLLQILDDFDRAIEAGEKSGAESAAAFMQGVVMIRSGLLTLLESKYGLQYYEAQGKPFNPEIHEAVATNPSAEVTEPTVGAELQKGYKLKERILRPAKVMVLMPTPVEEK